VDEQESMIRVAIVQARMSSKRLPGKVLADIAGSPMITFMLRRIERCREIDRIVVATSSDSSDDPLCEEVERNGFQCFRGSLTDVLDRYAGAASASAADVVVRLTADCPLIDADLIDKVVARLITGALDYVSNVDPPTFPDGLDVEAFTRVALMAAARDAKDGPDREHVTPFIRRDKNRFRQSNIAGILDLSALRWTVDHADDLTLIRSMIASLPPELAYSVDRFDFLRVVESRGAELPINPHARNESYPEFPSEPVG